MAEPTKLTRVEYIRKAKEWIKDNPKRWTRLGNTQEKRWTALGKILEELLGAPVWRFQPGKKNKVNGTPLKEGEEGVRYTIYNAGKATPGFKPNPTRKATRGGGSDGSRQVNERLITPDKGTRAAADRKMAMASTRGQVSHHGLPVSQLAAGEREKPGTMAAYEKVHGKDNVGHAPGALVDMDQVDHDYIHNVQEPELRKSIKAAGSQTDQVFDAVRKGVRSKTGLIAAGTLGLGAMIHGGPTKAGEQIEEVQLEDGNTVQLNRDRNQIIGDEGFGVEQLNGKYRKVARGAGAAGYQDPLEALRNKVTELLRWGST